MFIPPHDRASAFEANFPKRVKHGAGFIRATTAKKGQSIYATWCGGQDYQNASKLYGAFPKGFLEGALSLFPDADRILHLFSGSLTAAQVEGAWQRAVGDSNSWRTLRVAVKQVRFDNARHPAAAAALPDVIGDAMKLAVWSPARNFDLIIADPPYRMSDQRRYWRESMASLGTCTWCGRDAKDHEAVYTKSTHTGEMQCRTHKKGHAMVHGELERPGYVPFVPLNKKTVIHQCAEVLKPGGWLVWLDEIRPPYDNTRWVFRGGVVCVRSTNHRIRYATFLERR